MSKSNVPNWVNSQEYPFVPRSRMTRVGEMSYLDEGGGSPVVLIHGNPTWSFLYRRVIQGLRPSHRCIAPDLIGFGLSDKPTDWTYRAQDQAELLEELLESLDLPPMILVVGDWGGPLGFAYASRFPHRVQSIVVTNTWCWPVDDSAYYRAFSGTMGGPLGRWLIRSRNFFARDILRMAFGDKTKLTPEIHRHYLTPLAEPDDRRGCEVFPREILAATEWLRSLWAQRDLFLGKVRVVLWGNKDIAFRARERDRWRDLCPGARLVNLPNCGHFVAEEAPQDLIREVLALGKPHEDRRVSG